MLSSRPLRVVALALGAAIVLSLSLGLARVGRAQEQADARTVAGAVQAFYNQTKGVRARFHQTYYHKLYDQYERSQGTVVFAKAGKMRWDYARPNGKVMISDGRELTMYDPPEGEHAGQCFRRTMDEHQLPQAFSFLTGTGRLEDNFTFRLLDAARQGYRDGYVLELRPREPSPHYERLLFYVLGQNGRPTGVVRRVLIVDASGNRNRFDFSDMEWTPRVGDATFRFAPPQGVRCVRP
jgi:outer membrane lipoprotein carrier protein